ncbi:MAG: hypothetical protein KME59_19575 [Trichormus sp. ATA11-4-KO1]|jgi:hypothetical protein|nr:hypothetical protein [Trichormus sp. ATA11-4-KO1]
MIDILDSSNNLNLNIEPVNSVNQISQDNRESLKDKCQHLIDLSKIKLDLKKYADQLDGFTSRQEEITKAVQEIKPLMIAVRAFKQKNIINFDVNQKLDKLLNFVKIAEDNFRNDPESIIDNNKFNGKTFSRDIVSLKNSLHQSLIQAWKSYLNQYLPSTKKEMLEIFAEVVTLRSTIHKIYTLDKQIQEVEFPKNSEEFDRIDNLINELRLCVDSLNSDQIPEDVQNFLKTAATQGATIDLLTPEVKEWLIQHRLISSLRIRLN